MRRSVRLVGLSAAVLVLAASCTSGGNSSPTASTSGSGGGTSQIQSGGTLRVVVPFDILTDPQQDYNIFEQFWCCMLRNLYSLNGLPANQGGTALYPDLAVGKPQISSDQLTWTFKLQPNIHYAPPFQSTVITSKDFVTAMEREANPQGSVGGYSFYYTVIKGFNEYAAGKAKTISGMQTPNPTTLVIHLTQPVGDLDYRLALPAAAPIPPGAEALTTHLRDYGRFVVSSGPYMIQGSQNLNFSLPKSQQKPVSGYVPGKSLTLVRNPSWQRSTDPLRKAYVNTIQMSFGGSVPDLANKVESGAADVLFDSNPPADVIQKYYTDPSLKNQLKVNDTGHLQFIGINMAQPPFDDVHVRRALNYVLNKAALQRVFSGPVGGDIMGHMLASNLSGGQETTFDPYATSNSTGDLAKAKAEMMQSKYDPKHDGLCDVSACHNILAIARADGIYPQLAAIEQQNFQQLGITLNVRSVDFNTLYSDCPNLTLHVGLCLSIYWGPDYVDAYTELNPVLGSSSIGPGGCCNVTAMGATPQALSKAGYSTKQVPSIDSQIAACVPLTGNARLTCWINLDQHTMTNIVPMVPYLNDHNIELVSTRVTNYTHDAIGYMNFAQVALVNGGK